MKYCLAVILVASLSVQMTLAGQQAIVSTIGDSKSAKLVNTALDTQLDIPYFFTVPKSTYSKLPADLTTVHESTTEKMPLIMVDYTKIDQEDDETGASDLGLRLVLASGKDSRASVSKKLAESGLVKTGDIILSARPTLAGTIPYIHVQLGVTHAGMAVVKKDVDGKDYVYNVDMPLNSEMLGSKRDSKLSSEHYMDENAIFHIVRPKNLTDLQRQNVGAWLELFRTRSEKIYQPAPTLMETVKVANKISFNYDYMAPTYDPSKSGEDELEFVADAARLALGFPAPKGVAVFCSEFVWSVLSLRDCNPAETKSQFGIQKTPVCVSKFFEPMSIFGSLYESQNYDDDDQFGMSDGPIVLADVMKADAGPHKSGRSVRSRILSMSIFHKEADHKGSLSAGHLAVEEALLKMNHDFYKQVVGYYDLTALPETDQFQGQLTMRKMLRDGFNAANKKNYSPTAFFMHALMPNKFDGKQMTQKSIDYVATLIYLQSGLNIKVGTQKVDAYQVLLNTAKNTK